MYPGLAIFQPVRLVASSLEKMGNFRMWKAWGIKMEKKTKKKTGKKTHLSAASRGRASNQIASESDRAGGLRGENARTGTTGGGLRNNKDDKQCYS